MEYRPGADIFETGADVIVNPVNCRGRMGKGLAKAFKDRFPGIMEPYTRVCNARQLRPGMVQMIGVDRATGARAARGESDLMIANIATKDDWRDNSKLEWVDRGLEKLAGAIEERGLRSVALPALGAGLGGLPWKDVRSCIERHFRPLSEKGVQVMVCAEGPVEERPMAPRDPSAPAYAGIGARDTPPQVITKMQKIGRLLGEGGFVLRSGAADGADSAFERGADEARGPKEIFLPERGFMGRQPDGKQVFLHVTEAHHEMARKYHPIFDRLSPKAKNLMARNGSQLHGLSLDDPSRLVICWTEGGKVKGGTGQALRMANDPDRPVPVINLGEDRFRSMSAESIARVARDVILGETLGSALMTEKASQREAEAAL